MPEPESACNYRDYYVFLGQIFGSVLVFVLFMIGICRIFPVPIYFKIVSLYKFILLIYKKEKCV